MTLTLDQVILHTVVYHKSTSTYMPNFTEIKETFCGRTDVQSVAKFKIGYVIMTKPLLEHFVITWIVLTKINRHTKFEMPMFLSSKTSSERCTKITVHYRSKLCHSDQ